MKKLALSFAITLILVFALSACSTPYREEDFLGKSSDEIVAEFGPFDCVMMPASDDGLYRNCRCGYTIKEPKIGFLGTSPEILFYIRFDENGIATKCEEGYRPGG